MIEIYQLFTQQPRMNSQKKKLHFIRVSMFGLALQPLVHVVFLEFLLSKYINSIKVSF